MGLLSGMTCFNKEFEDRVVAKVIPVIYSEKPASLWLYGSYIVGNLIGSSVGWGH